MKKTFLSFIALVSVATAGFGQLTKPVKIDSLVTISLPLSYQEKDTLGQHIFFANSLVGFMEVIKAPNVKNTAPLKQEKDLNKVFKEYIASLQSQAADGDALNIRDTIIGTLKAKLFTLKIDNGNGDGDVKYKKYVLIYTTEATYTIEYDYPEYRQDMIADEYKAYVGSIKFARDLQRNDQYLFNTTGMATMAKIGLYAGIVLVIGVVVFFVLMMIKRRRKQ